MQKEEYESALENFKTAAALRPNDYLLRLRLGYAFYKTGDFDAARGAYNQAIILAPNYAQPRVYMGRFLLKTAVFSRAEQAFRSEF